MSQEKEKIAASEKALEYVKDGMRIGLGTGTTAAHFINMLIDSGKQIEAAATSIESEKKAISGNIPLLDINKVSTLDLTVDGADEIDPKKRLIKGAGGALVREKIIASMSKEMLVVADESKLVQQLGQGLLPVEIIPFGAASTMNKLHHLRLDGSLRKNGDGSLYVTDNGNWIIDLKFSSPLNKVEEMHQKIIDIPGTVDSGLFIGLATTVIIGKKDGSTEVL